uniref:Fibropellin-1-like n=1 Tax=Crassostrea virginica TaxID=6565 RepID=A0A8B8C858_CRAVI|nr:fibropellin-1-like [Crassostrea virginica]
MPCQNNGTCASTVGTSSYYNCSCTEGWEGINCEADIDECVNDPCNNSIRCINTVGSYLCLCHSGWTGRACNEDIDECIDDTQCYNNGTCINTPGSYTCNCSLGWGGSKCETDVNECVDTSVCNTSCINTPGSFWCLCEAGWTGKHCDQDIDECTIGIHGPYPDKGTCINTNGSFWYNCTTGWEGVPYSYLMAFASRIEYWNNPENQQRQLETLNSTLTQLKNNLTIDKTQISSSRIKRISAPDPRQSAAITGYMGAGILSFVFGLLLCLDLTMCFRRSADQ